MSYQIPVVIEPSCTHRATVIWMHGLGADGHDFEPIVPQLGVDNLGIRFIFPNAKVQPVTINGGMSMPSWYDIIGLDIDSRADAQGISESVDYVSELIQAEITAGINSKNIVMAGFSQGGVVGLHTALTFPQPLAGIMALSTYLPLVQELEPRLSPENRNTPIFQAHGSMDPVVSPMLGDMAASQLKQWGYNLVCHRYPMQHAVCPAEITEIGRWLKMMLE